MYSRKNDSFARHWDFVLLDVLSLVVAFLASYYVCEASGFDFLFREFNRRLLLGLVVTDLVLIYVTKMLHKVLSRGHAVELAYTIRNSVLLTGLTAIVLFGMKVGAFYSRAGIFSTMLVYSVLTYLIRVLYKAFYRKRIAPRVNDSLLIISNAAYMDALRERIAEGAFEDYNLAGLVLADAPEDFPADTPLPVVAHVADAVDWVRKNWVDEVLLLLPTGEDTTQYANTFVRMGITVHVGIEQIRGLVHNRQQAIEDVGGFHVVTAYWRSATPLEAFLKRSLDIVGGLIGCLVTLILIIFIGPAIYIASPGPIFYSQERIGRNGKVFRMYKFRSMYMDADARKKELMAMNRVGGGLMFKLDWDPRIIGNRELPDGTRKTGIGEFIRKTSLDEFPQFFNVLKGDMSLVGTRPPTKDEWERYEDHHRARMAMRPGVTGMWQVSGRSNITDFEEVVRLDTTYIDEWSLLLDIKILLKTILVVFTHEGSM